MITSQPTINNIPMGVAQPQLTEPPLAQPTVAPPTSTPQATGSTGIITAMNNLSAVLKQLIEINQKLVASNTASAEATKQATAQGQAQVKAEKADKDGGQNLQQLEQKISQIMARAGQVGGLSNGFAGQLSAIPFGIGNLLASQFSTLMGAGDQVAGYSSSLADLKGLGGSGIQGFAGRGYKSGEAFSIQKAIAMSGGALSVDQAIASEQRGLGAGLVASIQKLGDTLGKQSNLGVSLATSLMGQDLSPEQRRAGLSSIQGMLSQRMMSGDLSLASTNTTELLKRINDATSKGTSLLQTISDIQKEDALKKGIIASDPIETFNRKLSTQQASLLLAQQQADVIKARPDLSLSQQLQLSRYNFMGQSLPSDLMDAFKELPLILGKGKGDFSAIGRGGIASAQASAEMQIINSALGNADSIIQAIQADTRVRRTNISTQQDYEALGKTGETAAQALSVGLTVLSKGVNTLAGAMNKTIEAVEKLTEKFSFSGFSNPFKSETPKVKQENRKAGEGSKL